MKFEMMAVDANCLFDACKHFLIMDMKSCKAWTVLLKVFKRLWVCSATMQRTCMFAA